MPKKVIYAQTPRGNQLWQNKDPLARQVCDCLTSLLNALDQGTLLPLNPPVEQTEANVNLYLEAEKPEDLNNAFFDQIVQPCLNPYRSLLLELPNFEKHLPCVGRNSICGKVQP